VGISDGKPLGRPRRRRNYSININLKEIRWGDKIWLDLAQDRKKKLSCREDANKPSGSLKYGDAVDYLRNC
jgi:hypothetical protein